MTLATQGTMTFDVDGNTFSGADGSALTLFKASDGALLSGRSPTTRSAPAGWPIPARRRRQRHLRRRRRHRHPGPDHHQQHDPCSTTAAGIYADNTDGSYTANFTITGNTTAEPDANAFAGLVLTNGAPGSERHRQRLREDHRQRLQRRRSGQQQRRPRRRQRCRRRPDTPSTCRATRDARSADVQSFIASATTIKPSGHGRHGASRMRRSRPRPSPGPARAARLRR